MVGGLILYLVVTTIERIVSPIWRRPERVDTSPWGWRWVGETAHFFLSDRDGRFTPCCGLDADGESSPPAPYSGGPACQECGKYYVDVWMVQVG